MLRKAFNFFLFTSLFIVTVAAAMVWQTVSLLHIKSLNYWYYFFVIGGTTASYNVHWYLTNNNDAGSSESVRVVWTLKHKNILLPLAIVGLLMATTACWFLKEHWFWLMMGVLLASLYTAPKIPGAISQWLKKMAIAKTIYLTLAWVYVTTILPLIITGVTIAPADIVFIVYRFFLIFAICILFDYRDRESDLHNGIKSLITYLSQKGNNLLYYFSIAMAFVAVWLPGYYFFGMLTGLFLAVPLLVLLWLFPQIKVVSNDYLYYFVLDGLMAVSLLFTVWQ
jgi:4-hydroxybenzoate polyprenyltransferase